MTRSESDTLTTYKRADGEMIGDDFGWVTDDASLESEVDVRDDPLEFVEEVWKLESRRRFIRFPQAFSCQITVTKEDGETDTCDEDAEGWAYHDGEWKQACKEHGGVERTEVNVVEGVPSE